MRSFKFIVPLLILIVSFSFIVSNSGCGPFRTPDEIIEAAMGMHVDGHYSWPVIYLTDGGSNFSNPNNPVTGNPITNATVTVSNETTGISRVASYDATARSYTVSSELPHAAGQKVSLTIKTTNEAILGSATATPNPTYSNLNIVNNSTVSRPFTVSWEVTQGTSEATHTWVIIYGSTTSEAKNYQEVIPISQKSVEINASKIKTGGNNFQVVVFGINSMQLKGAKSGSAVYVFGGNSIYSMGITIEAQ